MFNNYNPSCIKLITWRCWHKKNIGTSHEKYRDVARKISVEIQSLTGEKKFLAIMQGSNFVVSDSFSWNI